MFKVSISRAPAAVSIGQKVLQRGFSSELRTEAEILVDKVHDLVRAATSGDFKSYAALNSPSSTCIEPETKGNIISGLAFHKHYFDLPPPTIKQPPAQTTLTNIRAKVCCKGQMGFVTYNRVSQNGSDVSVAQETRIWEKNASNEWVQVHFHKSLVD